MQRFETTGVFEGVDLKRICKHLKFRHMARTIEFVASCGISLVALTSLTLQYGGDKLIVTKAYTLIYENVPILIIVPTVLLGLMLGIVSILFGLFTEEYVAKWRLNCSAEAPHYTLAYIAAFLYVQVFAICIDLVYLLMGSLTVDVSRDSMAAYELFRLVAFPLVVFTIVYPILLTLSMIRFLLLLLEIRFK